MLRHSSVIAGQDPIWSFRFQWKPKHRVSLLIVNRGEAEAGPSFKLIIDDMSLEHYVA